MKPLVSIIIVNYNGLKHMQKCLDSISKVTYPNYEIMLVDNKSSDGSVEFVTANYPEVTIVKLGENKGFAEPNNIGAKLAKGKYLLFLNNDTFVEPDFLDEVVSEAESNPDTAICQSLLLKPDGSVDSSGDFIDRIGVVYNSKLRVFKTREISSARGASMLIRKKIFEKLGGFDEKFFATFEDVDLGWRAWIAGYRVLLNPKSIVYHVGGQTRTKMTDEISFHGFKNQLSMKITNFETNTAVYRIIKFFIIYGIREFRIWLDYKFYGKTPLSSTKYENNIAPKPSFKTIFSSIWWILCNQKYLIQKHRQVNSTRRYSTSQLEKMNVLCNT